MTEILDASVGNSHGRRNAELGMIKRKETHSNKGI